MNSVQLVGRLTREPEMRTAGETPVANFSVAIDRPTAAGKEKQTDFPRVVVYGKTAELCEQYLAKGRLVAVTGRLQTGSYKNKEGVTVYTTDVVADRVEFLEWGDKGESTGDASSESAGKPPAKDKGKKADAPNPGTPASQTPPPVIEIDDDDIPF